MHYSGTKWQTVSLPAGLIPAFPDMQPERMLAVSPSNVWATAYDFSVPVNKIVPGPVLLAALGRHSWTKIAG